MLGFIYGVKNQFLLSKKSSSARVVELVDTLVLGTSGVTLRSSSLRASTKKKSGPPFCRALRQNAL